MTLKPPFPRPKTERLPERKAVTIIAGFKFHDGVVICADTQETTEHSKRYVPKLVFEPKEQANGSRVDLAAAFCGSSNDGAFVDKLIANAWESAQGSASLDEACREIEQNIKSTYREFGRIYQPGYCPTADLIYGVKMYDGTKLFVARGPIVNQKDTYDSSGVGYYMADFLAGRMYENYLNVRQCIILAAYILFQAKEHVEGCGGDSHIAVLQNDGTSGLIDWKQVETMTEILKQSDHSISNILLKLADFDLLDEQIKRYASISVDALNAFRSHRIKEMKESQSLLSEILGGKKRDEDSLGFPKSLESE